VTKLDTKKGKKIIQEITQE